MAKQSKQQTIEAPLILTPPDFASMDQAKLLRDGLDGLLERTHRGLQQAMREGTGTNDAIRYQQELELKELIEFRNVPQSERLTDEQHAANAAFFRDAAFEFMFKDLYSLWEIMNRIATRHGLEDPPAWTVTQEQRYDIGILTDAYRAIERWARKRQTEIDKGEKVWTGYKSPQDWCKLLKWSPSKWTQMMKNHPNDRQYFMKPNGKPNFQSVSLRFSFVRQFAPSYTETNDPSP